MQLLSVSEIVRRTLHDICPLLYLGQLWQLVLAHDPRTPQMRSKGKAAFHKWAKSKRDKVADTAAELVRKGELGEFTKDRGYFHEPIVTKGPLLRVEPRSEIGDLVATSDALRVALKQACGPDRLLKGYFVPTEFKRDALRNPFYRRAVTSAQERSIDRRDGTTIEAFRIGSVYVSQFAYNRREAETFKLLYREAPDCSAAEPHASISRKDGPTELYAVDTRLVDQLEELSCRQRRNNSWLELWL